eukprot:gene15028-17776_t
MQSFTIVLIAALAFVAIATACTTSPFNLPPVKRALGPADLKPEELLHHERLMNLTIAAKATFNTTSIFTALIAHNNGTVLCTGRNQGKLNSLNHAEMEAMNNCTRMYGMKNFANHTLYSTGESCPMCVGAAMWNAMDRIVYASSNRKLHCDYCLGEILMDSEVVANANGLGFKNLEIIGGIMANYTDNVHFKSYCNTSSIYFVQPNCTANFQRECPNPSTASTFSGFLQFAVVIAALIALFQ